MKIFPGMHYTMGGLWVDFNQMTNIPGIFAAGECEYQYHGANRLGANSLVSCIFGGFHAGPNALKYAKSVAGAEGDGGAAAEVARQAEINNKLHQQRGQREPLQAVARAGPDHDRARDRDPLQQGPEAGRRKDRRAARPLQEREPERQEPVGEHQLRLRAPAQEHAGAFAHRCAGRASARRVARRALQARLSRAQRREVPEDHQGQLYRLRRRPDASSTKKWIRSTSSRARGGTTRRSDSGTCDAMSIPEPMRRCRTIVVGSEGNCQSD